MRPISSERIAELIIYFPAGKPSDPRVSVVSRTYNEREYRDAPLSVEAGTQRVCAKFGASLKIDGAWYSLAVLCWALHTGNWPKNPIYHKDGDPLNYRWDNMVMAS